jgi:hypothetical protein
VDAKIAYWQAVKDDNAADLQEAKRRADTLIVDLTTKK